MCAIGLMWVLGGKRTNERGRQVYVWVERVADSGFFEATSQGEPDPLQFASAADRQSVLRGRWLKLPPVSELGDGLPWQFAHRQFGQSHAELWPDWPGEASTTWSQEGVETGGVCVPLEAMGTAEGFREQFAAVVVGEAGRLAEAR